MLPVMIALVMLCLLILFGVSLIVICVKRRKKKRRNREFEISSFETPELTYDIPAISISQYISMEKMTDEKQKKLTLISSSETPEHTYEEPDTSISQFNQKFSTLKMRDENHKDSIMVEENVAYGSFVVHLHNYIV